MKLFLTVLSCIFCTGHISFAESRLTYNSYGMPGLVDMPSSQSAPDAELSFSISQAGKSLRNTLMFQISPRADRRLSLLLDRKARINTL